MRSRPFYSTGSIPLPIAFPPDWAVTQLPIANRQRRYSKGTNNSWQWGTPAKAIINKAANGTKAWVTSMVPMRLLLVSVIRSS